MTLINPQCRVLAGGSFTASDVLTTTHTAMGTSTKFDIDLTGGGGAGDGFALTSKTNTVPQLIFRRTGTYTIEVSIEPSGSVTSIGDTVTPPTGTSADWSGERTWTLGALSGSSRIMLSELDDALFWLTTDSTHSTFESSVQIGRILEQEDAGDASLGRDGLGFLVGIPGSTTSTAAILWMTRTTFATGVSMIHVATNNWKTLYSNSIGYTSTRGGSEDAGLFTFFRPVRFTDTINAGGYQTSLMARFKYYRTAGQVRSPRQVFWNDAASNQAWMTLHDNVYCCPWDKTVATV
jgi:hypothetical protein